MAERGREVLEGFLSHSLAAGDLLHFFSWMPLSFSMQLLEVNNVYQVCISIFDQVLPHLLQRSNGAQSSFSIHCYSEYFLTCSLLVNSMTVSCGSCGSWSHLCLLRQYKNVWGPSLVKSTWPPRRREELHFHLITEQFTKLLSPGRLA